MPVFAEVPQSTYITEKPKVADNEFNLMSD